MRWGIEEDTYIPVFFQSTKGSLKHKVSLSFDLDHTSSIGNLILDDSTLLALALQNPMTDLNPIPTFKKTYVNYHPRAESALV